RQRTVAAQQVAQRVPEDAGAAGEGRAGEGRPDDTVVEVGEGLAEVLVGGRVQEVGGEGDGRGGLHRGTARPEPREGVQLPRGEKAALDISVQQRGERQRRAGAGLHRLLLRASLLRAGTTLTIVPGLPSGIR